MDINIDDFTQQFPYGFLGEREAEYVNNVQKYVDQFEQDQRDLVIDLLDLQWVSYIQQIWLITDRTGTEEAGKIHFALARLPKLPNRINPEPNHPLFQTHEDWIIRSPSWTPC